jgi:hypothetical protein
MVAPVLTRLIIIIVCVVMDGQDLSVNQRLMNVGLLLVIIMDSVLILLEALIASVCQVLLESFVRLISMTAVGRSVEMDYAWIW